MCLDGSSVCSVCDPVFPLENSKNAARLGLLSVVIISGLGTLGSALPPAASWGCFSDLCECVTARAECSPGVSKQKQGAR